MWFNVQHKKIYEESTKIIHIALKSNVTTHTVKTCLLFICLVLNIRPRYNALISSYSHIFNQNKYICWFLSASRFSILKRPSSIHWFWIWSLDRLIICSVFIYIVLVSPLILYEVHLFIYCLWISLRCSFIIAESSLW